MPKDGWREFDLVARLGKTKTEWDLAKSLKNNFKINWEFTALDSFSQQEQILYMHFSHLNGISCFISCSILRACLQDEYIAIF